MYVVNNEYISRVKVGDGLQKKILLSTVNLQDPTLSLSLYSFLTGNGFLVPLNYFFIEFKLLQFYLL